MSKEFWIILLVLGCIIAAPMILNFVDWIIYGNETPEQKRKRLERQCQESIKQQQEEELYENHKINQ